MYAWTSHAPSWSERGSGNLWAIFVVVLSQHVWDCQFWICHVTSREKLVMPAKHRNGTAVQVTWQWCNTKQFMYFRSQEIACKLPDPLLGWHTCKTNDYSAHFYLNSGAHCMEISYTTLLTNSERLWPSAWNNTWVPRWQPQGGTVRSWLTHSLYTSAEVPEYVTLLDSHSSSYSQWFAS